MRVFVAGATGAIGRPLVPRLLAAGHEVVGMTRSEERAAALRTSGAQAVVCDVYDREALAAAVAEARPDVVVNQLTDIPPAIDPRKYEEQMAGLARIRTEGYGNLVAAADAAGTKIIAQSISFMYRPAPGLASEDDPLWTDAAEPARTTAVATAEGERMVLDAGGIVLRYGWFYGPGTSYAADGGISAEVHKRRYPIVGKGDGMLSFIHVDDAADATVAALGKDFAGALNIVDDDPAPMKEVLPVLATNLGAKKPRRVPAFVARFAVGKFAADFATKQRGASNARAKEVLGWSPAHASWRDDLGT
jgi:nucleoside-diphosphate-sugar epimerase